LPKALICSADPERRPTITLYCKDKPSYHLPVSSPVLPFGLSAANLPIACKRSYFSQNLSCFLSLSPRGSNEGFFWYLDLRRSVSSLFFCHCGFFFGSAESCFPRPRLFHAFVAPLEVPFSKDVFNNSAISTNVVFF